MQHESDEYRDLETAMSNIGLAFSPEPGLQDEIIAAFKAARPIFSAFGDGFRIMKSNKRVDLQTDSVESYLRAVNMAVRTLLRVNDTLLEWDNSDRTDAFSVTYASERDTFFGLGYGLKWALLPFMVSYSPAIVKSKPIPRKKIRLALVALFGLVVALMKVRAALMSWKPDAAGARTAKKSRPSASPASTQSLPAGPTPGGAPGVPGDKPSSVPTTVPASRAADSAKPGVPSDAELYRRIMQRPEKTYVEKVADINVDGLSNYPTKFVSFCGFRQVRPEGWKISFEHLNIFLIIAYQLRNNGDIQDVYVDTYNCLEESLFYFDERYNALTGKKLTELPFELIAVDDPDESDDELQRFRRAAFNRNMRKLYDALDAIQNEIEVVIKADVESLRQ